VVTLTLVASFVGGKMSGLAVGATAAVVRILGLMLLNFVASTNDMLTMDGGAAASVLFSSLLLLVIGYAPGRTLEHFEKRREEDIEMF
jgi:hypothetical protein